MSPPTDSLPIDLDLLSNAELKRLVVKQWEDLAELHRVVAALRDEITRLKDGPPRPNIRPSGMEPTTDPKPLPGSERRTRGDTRSKLSIDEERIVKSRHRPARASKTPLLDSGFSTPPALSWSPLTRNARAKRAHSDLSPSGPLRGEVMRGCVKRNGIYSKTGHVARETRFDKSFGKSVGYT